MTLFPGVALVTGAASGIGRATAIAFAVDGCRRIAICDRDLPGLEATRALIIDIKREDADVDVEMEVEVLQVDILKEDDIERMVRMTVRRWGRVDYAVNAAGIIGNNAPSTSTSSAQFDLVTNINYRGCWLSSRAELAQMVGQEVLPSHDGRPGERGSVVNIASQLGVVGRPNAPAYCASKAAVIGMTRCDAIDTDEEQYSKHNIRVNCVCPGVIATPMTQGDAVFRKALEPAIDIAPMQRMGTAQEIADACLFLCSSKASFVQGHALVVDGGYVIN
ncbi:Levodione reductase [Lachnellula subtilissima]|uniref:Levodione reductase n=1 Tax=Lachnellula subtilissima TaxID=602034 RepID=A0A8H8RSW4_9HELO|nr:Levodione reductase [Lachnellula subtilissima]